MIAKKRLITSAGAVAAGGPLPADLPREELERLTRLGAIGAAPAVEPSETPADASWSESVREMSRDELEAEAERLGVHYEDGTTDDNLAELIVEHEVDPDAFDRDALLAEADLRGVSVKANAKKADIAAAINGASG